MVFSFLTEVRDWIRNTLSTYLQSSVCNHYKYFPITIIYHCQLSNCYLRHLSSLFVTNLLHCNAQTLFLTFSTIIFTIHHQFFFFFFNRNNLIFSWKSLLKFRKLWRFRGNYGGVRRWRVTHLRNFKNSYFDWWLFLSAPPFLNLRHWNDWIVLFAHCYTKRIKEIVLKNIFQKE